MAFIKMNMLDVQEPKPVPGGQRYSLTILSAEETEANEKPICRISLGIDDHPEAPAVNFTLWYPQDGDEAWKTNKSLLTIKRFLTQFKIPHTDEGFDVDDLPGAQATGQLILSEPNEKGDQYNNLVLDRLPSASPVVKQASKKRA